MKRLAFLAVLCVSSLALAEPSLVLHEWGTFTSLQDEAGRSVGWLNVEEERLPGFAHELNFEFVGNTDSQRHHSVYMKGYPHSHADVTLRLETPVIYFHAAPGSTPPPMDLSVQFMGGYLTQFYPEAASSRMEGRLTADSRSRLDWHALQLGGNKALPPTDSHVWTAPRNVNASQVTNSTGETEQFLFYRGVGHVDAPLRLVHESSQVEIHSQLAPALQGTPLKIGRLWFCEFHDGGRCAFRELDPVMLTGDPNPVLATTPLDFEGEKFTAGNLDALKKSMREGLVHDGLNVDEADALLSTWELSYFQSSGTRLFFLVPRAWTDHYLPLEMTPAAPISRVMVGRIDLITPEHRRLLHLMADNPDPVKNEGAMWESYDRLGRFRNALVLDELSRRPATALEAFVKKQALEASRP